MPTNHHVTTTICCCLFVACCTACSVEPVGHLLIEYQPRHAVVVEGGDWLRGNAIVVAEPTFPQPLSVRVRVVDEADADYGVARGGLTIYSATQLQVVTSGCHYARPDEAARYCAYDFDVVGPGASMLLVTANAPHDGTLRDCFYYAIVPPTTDVDGLRATLDSQLAACRNQ